MAAAPSILDTLPLDLARALLTWKEQEVEKEIARRVARGKLVVPEDAQDEALAARFNVTRRSA